MSKNLIFRGVAMASIMLLSLAATACATPRVYKVGIVNPAGFDDVVKGFKDGLTKLGYTEGKNLTYVYGGPLDDANAQISYATTLENQKVDLIFANGTTATISAQKGTKTTPIVFAPVAYPLEAGIVSSIANPGGHTTGVQNGGSDSKRLDYLLTVVPTIKRIYVPIRPDDTVSQLALKVVQQAADKLGITLVIHEIKDDATLADALANFPSDVDAMFFLPGPWLEDSMPKWVDLSIQKKLPFATEAALDDGGLITYIAEDYQVGYKAASLADKVFKGSAVGAVPVESPEFSLGVNLKTAKAIGVTIPDTLLSQAKSVIR